MKMKPRNQCHMSREGDCSSDVQYMYSMAPGYIVKLL